MFNDTIAATGTIYVLLENNIKDLSHGKGPFDCINLLCSGQVAEVPGSIWGEGGGKTEDLSREQ